MSEITEKKSVIHKRISRKINTAPYENIEVSCEFQEEITWNDLKERQMKSEKITKLLITDFNRTLAQVMDELNLQRKGAVVRNG
tara:strand:+ start:261 stop:512 length:252 start_codon:yes stop_codon:yes gene_type:complete